MGRLFWKFFFASWCALVIAAVGAAAAVSLQFHAADQRGRPPPLHRIELDLAASTLRHGGPDALRDWLKTTEHATLPHMYVVDAKGEDLLGRTIPASEASLARAAVAKTGTDERARLVSVGEDDYLLFVRRPPGAPRLSTDMRRGPPVLFPWPWLHVIAGTLASIVVSALLAWYMARPIRSLREAFDAAANGQLDTRVAPRMGARRDEIADLGRDFDRMAEQLQRLVGGQRRLLHDVSHELRSPLARLQAAIGLLRQGPETLDQSLARIERESARLDELVGEVLTLARLDSGAIGGLPDKVNLADLVADAAGDARFEAEASGKSVSVDRLDEAVMTGRVQLIQRAVDNVMRNAVKYTAPGSTVRIALAHESPPSRAVLSVSDNGPGMSAQDIENMFEPFFRASSAADGQGFGLGLAIARRAIDMHGGTIRAENIAGGGLRVTIELPLDNT